jgi:hypothetical protein
MGLAVTQPTFSTLGLAVTHLWVTISSDWATIFGDFFIKLSLKNHF